MKFLSPAKINLFLRVLFRREDGYHEIASLFQAVNLFDEITFNFATVDRLTSTSDNLPLDERNLIVKALHLFRKKTNSPHFFHIHLNKKIPIQAGVGGGSSNAATTLFALNALHGFQVNELTLKSWSEELGSDVPFFFSKGSSYCTGRGEIFENVKITSQNKIWLVKPQNGLSTPLIFKNLKLNECSDKNPKELLDNFLKGNFSPVNDLEKPAFTLLPELKKLKEDLLSQGFERVFLTGSGTALVCLGKNIPDVTYPTTCYPLLFISREEKQWYS